MQDLLCAGGLAPSPDDPGVNYETVIVDSRGHGGPGAGEERVVAGVVPAFVPVFDFIYFIIWLIFFYYKSFTKLARSILDCFSNLFVIADSFIRLNFFMVLR